MSAGIVVHAGVIAFVAAARTTARTVVAVGASRAVGGRAAGSVGDALAVASFRAFEAFARVLDAESVFAAVVVRAAGRIGQAVARAFQLPVGAALIRNRRSARFRPAAAVGYFPAGAAGHGRAAVDLLA
jgi:hypothetical protein